MAADAAVTLKVGDGQEVAGSSSAGADSSEGHGGVCAICLERILLKETAVIKGCDHAYCVTCILRWACYKDKPYCPTCKHPFNFLSLHKSLDGCIHDFMFEESVCLLLRAAWFVPLVVDEKEDIGNDEFDSHYYQYEDDYIDDDDFEDTYFTRNVSNLRIGNRRWGDSGYVRAGRREARPMNRQIIGDADAGPSRSPRKEFTGRRAKRALKREAADKAAKEQNHSL